MNETENNKEQPKSAFSVGALAKRWGVSPERVRSLVEAGKVPGAFVIPSAGRYGRAIRISKEAVLEVESRWSVAPAETAAKRPNKTRRGGPPALTHFPELAEPRDCESA